MSTVIAAANATNGLSFTADSAGTFDFKTGPGAGTTALTIDANQDATFAGTLTATGGVIASLTSATAQASTSGTSIDFTSIPAGVKRITVMFSGVSLNASSNVLVQLGTSGGVVSSGYASTASRGAATIATSNATTGFFLNGGNGTEIISGLMTITNLSGNTWISSHSVKLATTITSYGGGDVTLSGTLDRVRITSLNGTDTFDAGTINIIYE